MEKGEKTISQADFSPSPQRGSLHDTINIWKLGMIKMGKFLGYGRR
jgi:hypothetical protein